MPSMIKPLPPKKPIPLPANTYASAGLVKAVDINILLEDGTRLVATGGHAADIYNYLMDCERYCATNIGTVSPYLGPMLNRFDPSGNNTTMSSKT